MGFDSRTSPLRRKTRNALDTKWYSIFCLAKAVNSDFDTWHSIAIPVSPHGSHVGDYSHDQTGDGRLSPAA
jgi:hypothetical protein